MTSSELAPVAQSSLTERMEYAKALAHSGLLPPAYQQKPANVLYAVEYAAALSLPPMTAITGIHIIAGKPSLSADLMAALVRRAGHKLRVKVENLHSVPKTEPVAVAQLIRADDPDFTYEARWDLEKAKKAGLLAKAGDNWAKFPVAMLKARAISEVVREGASEVLHGLIYTPEELGGGHVDEEATGELVDEQSEANEKRDDIVIGVDDDGLFAEGPDGEGGRMKMHRD